MKLSTFLLHNACSNPKPKRLEVRINGNLKPGVTAKDLILGVIAKYGTDFATGYVIEYTGEAIRGLVHGRAYDGL